MSHASNLPGNAARTHHPLHAVLGGFDCARQVDEKDIPLIDLKQVWLLLTSAKFIRQRFSLLDASNNFTWFYLTPIFKIQVVITCPIYQLFYMGNGFN